MLTNSQVNGWAAVFHPILRQCWLPVPGAVNSNAVGDRGGNVKAHIQCPEEETGYVLVKQEGIAFLF